VVKVFFCKIDLSRTGGITDINDNGFADFVIISYFPFIRELPKTTDLFLLTTEDTENTEEFLIGIETLFNGNF
jgi:hypothetical protein